MEYAAASATAIRIMPVSYAMSNHRNVVTKMMAYGHIWSTIGIFYRCVVLPLLLERPTSLPRHVIIPDRLANDTRTGGRGASAFQELQTIFSGPGTGLTIHRAAWVPICYAADGLGCCATNGSVAAVPQVSAIAALLKSGSHEEQQVSLLGSRPPGPLTSLDGVDAAGVAEVRLTQLNVDEAHNLVLMRGVEESRHLRRLAWTNVGIPERLDKPSRLVLWASSERPSNGRRIANEGAIVQRVRAHLNQAWPTHTFMHQRLTDLSFAQEIRLMRRAAVFISLFGSALYNCRWMSPGAIVVEIRGAMKNDFSAYAFYANLCANNMGLRWTGLTTVGHTPRQITDPTTGRVSWGGHARQADYWVAKVDAGEVIKTLDHALWGNFTHLIHQFTANITWKKDVGDWAGRLLGQPQYVNRTSVGWVT